MKNELSITDKVFQYEGGGVSVGHVLDLRLSL